MTQFKFIINLQNIKNTIFQVFLVICLQTFAPQYYDCVKCGVKLPKKISP